MRIGCFLLIIFLIIGCSGNSKNQNNATQIVEEVPEKMVPVKPLLDSAKTLLEQAEKTKQIGVDICSAIVIDDGENMIAKAKDIIDDIDDDESVTEGRYKRLTDKVSELAASVERYFSEAKEKHAEYSSLSRADKKTHQKIDSAVTRWLRSKEGYRHIYKRQGENFINAETHDADLILSFAKYPVSAEWYQKRRLKAAALRVSWYGPLAKRHRQELKKWILVLGEPCDDKEGGCIYDMEELRGTIKRYFYIGMDSWRNALNL